MKIGERFRRWRATKGYGVHSPLGYRIVTHAVRPKSVFAYYGEEILENSQSTKRDIKRACLLLRFVAQIQPSYVWISPKLPEIFVEAIRLAGCVVRIFEGTLYPDEIEKADLLVLYDFKLKKADLKKILRPGVSLIAFNPPNHFLEWLKSTMKGGVILDCISTQIAVSTNDPGLHVYHLSSL